MEEQKVKNIFSFTLSKKAIAALALFLFLGVFFTGSIGDFSAKSVDSSAKFSFSFGPSVVFAQPASATPAPVDKGGVLGDLSSGLANLLANFVSLLVSAIGFFLGIIMSGLIIAAQYNDFTTSSAVLNGWVIVRDLCNMFFILILLVIAFATILRVEGYDIKKMVPKLIIMAVLINFSKTICALIIDFAQIIMNAFISPIAQIGALNITTMLGLNDLLTFVKDKGSAADNWGVLLAYIFAFFYSLIAAVVLVVIFAILIVRIVMIWIYVVLSPLAYLLATFPQGKSYVSQWWDEFIKNVTVGPILAFFIWLSLVSLGNTTSGSQILGVSGADTDDSLVGLTGAMTIDQLLKFAISIGMLVGGLIVTQKMGGYMGNFAGKGMAKIQGGVKALGKGTVGAADWLNRKQAGFTGQDLNLARRKEKFVQAFEVGKKRDLSKINLRSSALLQKGGMTGALLGTGASGYADTYLQGFMGWKGIRQAVRGGKERIDGLRNEEKEVRTQAGLVVSDVEIADRANKFTEEKKRIGDEKIRISDEYKKKEDAAQAKADAIKAGTPGGENSKEYKEAYKELESVREERDKRLAAQDLTLKKTNDDENNFNDRVSKAKLAGLHFADDRVASSKRLELQKKASDLSSKAAAYTIFDYEGMATRRSARAEAQKKASSENEDELIAQFQVAVEKGDEPLAEALLAQLAKIGGTNALFNRYGYQAKSGLSKREREGYVRPDGTVVEGLDARAARGDKDAIRTIENEKGFNDFVRDIFVKKLKVDEQAAYALQSDIGSIGETVGKEHLMKTVNVNSSGQFFQCNREEREESKLREALKTESENNIRKMNRLFYGAENKDTGEFEWSDFGLAMAVNNLGLIEKEIGANRFNKSAARAMAETKALEALVNKIKAIGVENVRDKDGKQIDLNSFVSKLKAYAAAASEDNIHKLLADNVPPPAAGGTNP